VGEVRPVVAGFLDALAAARVDQLAAQGMADDQGIPEQVGAKGMVGVIVGVDDDPDGAGQALFQEVLDGEISSGKATCRSEWRLPK
jgi:hypothetical protein